MAHPLLLLQRNNSVLRRNIKIARKHGGRIVRRGVPH